MRTETTQPAMFDMAVQEPKFAGATFDAALDEKRLTTLQQRVQSAMSDGNWYTLGELQAICGGSEAGVSARLRDLRKPAWGSHTIERRRRGEGQRGLFEYRFAN